MKNSASMDPLEKTSEAHRVFTREQLDAAVGLKENTRSRVLQTAEKLVNGDRNTQYGDPIDDFRRTADMWSAYLGDDLKIPLEPHDVAAMMGMLKLSRIRWSPQKGDSWIDLAGYAACGLDCAERE